MSKVSVILTFALYFTVFTSAKTSTLNDQKVQWQIKDAKNIYLNEATQTPSFIKFNSNNLPGVEHLEKKLMQWYQLKAPYGFDAIGTESDQLGFVHYRFRQTYQGYPVKSMRAYIHTKNGKIVSVNGEVCNTLKESYLYQLNFLNALDIAKKYVGAEKYKWEIPQEEFHLTKRSQKKSKTYFPEHKLILIEDKTGEYKLCYEINIFAHKPESRNLVFINATTGKIELVENLICSNNIPTNIETKNSGERNVIVNDSIVAGKYALVDFTRGNGIGVFDSRNFAVITDDDNSWTLDEYDNAERDYTALDCHWGATSTYDYFFNVHNRNSFDNNGSAIECRVHQTYQNGSTNNATWTGSYLSFGDGLGFNNAFTVLDVIAHEFTHGVTGSSANLIYAGESGALNESFSDIFGTATEFYAKPPNESGNWLLAEEIGFPLRNLANPNSNGDPDTYGNNDPFWVKIDGCWPQDQNDLCGVHINSGVQNHWFYLLANGGSGTNHNGDSYNVTGIGIEKAAEIAYRNLIVYLTPRSRYNDAKRYAIQSAIDLYGECPAPKELISTINAWYAVGLGEEYTADNQLQAQINPLSPTYYCSAPQTVNFYASSNFPNTNYTWNFNNEANAVGDTVSHTFAKAGTYTVTLKADGCNTTNIKTAKNLIVIDSIAPCVLTMPLKNKHIETVCSGTLYDVNGPQKPYSDLSDGVITIVSPYNEPVNLLFTELGYELNYDYLYIHDGPDTSANLITSLNGYDLPDTISSTGNSITIRHFSDLYVVDDGFTLNWWSDSCDPNTCPNQRLLTANEIAASGFFKAKSVIKSNQIITNNNELIYTAGDTINLINNFEVTKDGNFSAIIENCEP